MANLGHAVWDYVDEKYITVSEGWARIFGYSKESFLETITNLGKDFELILPEDRDRYRTYYDNEDPDLKAPDIEYRVVRRSGEVRYIYERYRYVLDSSGERTQVLVTIQDITKRKQAEEALEKTDELLTQSAAMANLGHAVWDYIGEKYIAVSDGWARIFGYTQEEYLATFTDLEKDFEDIHPEDRERYCVYHEDSDPDNLAPEIEYRIIRRDGEIRHIHECFKYVLDPSGKRTQLLVSIQDITERNHSEQALSFQATHDALTGLINRGEFERRIQRVLDTARTLSVEHALCYLGLDQFKVINDTCGHMAGDELLRQLGDLLSALVRKRDTLARLGGDEFGVLMEHCTLEQANRVANEVRNTVAEFRFVWEEQIFRVGVSIGLVPITDSSGSVASLLSAADSACYAAKEEGRNRVHVYTLDDTELARRQGEMAWVARINQALDDQRLQLWSQPIVPVISSLGEGEHFELLLRLVNEQGTTIPPGAFLPAAERYGLATKLDRWVISKAFDWLNRDRDLQDRLHLCCINLSGVSLADEEFLVFVQQQLEKFRIPPWKICFEVTETAAITNLSRAMAFMGSLKKRGCRFVLDDFGSGLSSFAYLKTLPVDYLKIDGAFVKDIVDDEVDLALVRSINDVGKVMGKRTVAEFVENAAILQKLREIGVDYAQGYGISRPAPIDEADRDR